MEISAGEFKAKCLKLMDEVAHTGEPIVITKRGKPVARLMPPEERAPSSRLFGYMAGTINIQGDIINMPPEAWAAENATESHLYAAEPLAKYKVPPTSTANKRKKRG